MEVEQLTAGLADLELGPDSISFKAEFEKVIREAKLIYPRLSPSEIKITRMFASPFSPGGLLVLLLQPRSNHPWERGIDAVIEDCPTLDLLNEGLGICASTTLQGNISILDFWTCLPWKVTNSLDCAQKSRFLKVILAAIEAKQPDCILCMGTVNTIDHEADMSQSHGTLTIQQEVHNVFQQAKTRPSSQKIFIDHALGPSLFALHSEGFGFRSNDAPPATLCSILGAWMGSISVQYNPSLAIWCEEI